MTPGANYAAFVDNIFGAGSAKFDIAKTDTNNVVGALASPQRFAEFTANFEERLRRINAAKKTPYPKTITIEPEFIVRASTAPAPAAV